LPLLNSRLAPQRRVTVTILNHVPIRNTAET
jgi:hypothetical protein